MTTAITVINEKLSKAAKALSYVKRDRKHGMGFTFLSSHELIGLVNHTLQEVGLVVRGTKQEILNVNGHVYTVRVSAEVACKDTDAFVVFQGIASGHDTGDKAVSKAVTMAQKSMWLGAFTISTGDEESTVEDARRVAWEFTELRLPETTTLAGAAGLFVQYEADFAAGGAKVRDAAKLALWSHASKAFKATMEELAAAVASATEARANGEVQS